MQPTIEMSGKIDDLFAGTWEDGFVHGSSQFRSPFSSKREPPSQFLHVNHGFRRAAVDSQHGQSKRRQVGDDVGQR